MSRELDAKAAFSMVRVFSWLDRAKFGRVVSPSNENTKIIRHRGGPEQHRDAKVVYTAELSVEHREQHIKAANATLGIANFELPNGSREAVLQIQSLISSKFGAEGCKRFAELSHVAFCLNGDNGDTTGQNSLSEFWADFRTFLDLEKATSVGQPFKIDHYLGEYFVANDEKGARVEHYCGAAISLSSLMQMSRPQQEVR